MTDIDRIAKRFGSVNHNGTYYVWDYAKNIRRKENEMTVAEKKASEAARYASKPRREND